MENMEKELQVVQGSEETIDYIMLIGAIRSNPGDWASEVGATFQQEQSVRFRMINTLGKLISDLRQPLEFPLQTEGEAFYLGGLIGFADDEASTRSNPKQRATPKQAYRAIINFAQSNQQAICDETIAAGREAVDLHKPAQRTFREIQDATLADKTLRYYCESGYGYGSGLADSRLQDIV